jgi:UDP-4-amino-4,6-dideoxy-N-acetyl-beta-L-altrosamine N-acetyltransferase
VKLEGYGIVLTRLTAHDLELVRVKRNSEEVRSYMQFRDEITPEMQVKWFSSIDNEHNNYFLIHHGNEKVGMISGAEIDWTEMETNNGGLFIWDQSLWGTTTPLMAALLLTELSFRLGFKKNYVRVLPQNKRATEFNSRLGYVKEKEQSHLPLETQSLTAQHFFNATEEMRKKAQALFPGKLRCTIDDKNHPASANIVRVYSQLTDQEKSHFDFIVK